MAETAPLLTEGNPSLDNSNYERQIDEIRVANTHAAAQLKRLTITALFLSGIGSVLFLASYIIARNAPFTSWYNWDAGHVNVPLAIVTLLSAVFCIFSLYFKIPVLLAYIIQVALVAYIIPFLALAFHESRFPSSKWCRLTFRVPSPGNPVETIYPHPQCQDWRLALSILMGTAIGFAIIICVIYIGTLTYRTFTTVFGITWKGRNLLTFSLPTGTFKFEVNIGFVRQEPVQQVSVEGESSTSTAHGPLYL